MLNLKIKIQEKQRVDPVFAFLQDLEVSGKSANTIRNYKADLSALTEAVKKPLLELSTQDIKIYFASLLGLSVATRGRKSASLSSFFSWAVKNDLVDSNPMAKIDKIKIPSKEPRPIMESKLDSIFKAIPKSAKRDKLFFILLLESGIRVKEALTIRIETICLTEGHESLTVIGKGGDQRSVYIEHCPDTLILLKEYLAAHGKDSGYLFTAINSDEPLSYAAAWHAWSKYCERANVQGFTIHALRHTFCTNLIQQGFDTPVVQKLMGHKNIQTTMRYSAVMEHKIKDEYSKKYNHKSRIG